MTTTVRSRRGGSPGSRRKPTRSTSRARFPRAGRRQRSSPGRQRPSTHGLFKVIGAVLLAGLLAGAAFLMGAFTKVNPAADVAAQIVYTAPTANDARFTLPESVKADLRRIGLSNDTIALTRVDSTGEVRTSVLDLTPRVNNKPNSPILKVYDRAIQAIDLKIAALETDINSHPATSGNRALYVGLLKTNFVKNVPLYIISSGLDLTNPIDTRSLAFDVPPSQVVDRVKAAGEVPDLNGAHVTYVMVPSTGAQDQLRRPQKDYIKSLWEQLLTGAGASSVHFVDATGTTSASPVPAPPVLLPALPGTPIKPVTRPESPQDTVCELSASTYFVFSKAQLVDRATTKADLKDCVGKAGKNTTVTLDAWTSYEGPVTEAGKPTMNPAYNIALSNARNQTIADLLEEMGIDRGRITRMTGHGNDNQPYPKDPGSQKNRVCTLTFSPTTTK
jgi:outer membrane protein OmpA-like peptidoglycan-associated protein